MRSRGLVSIFMEPRTWWLPLTVIITISLAGVIMIGVHTYTEAPPRASFVSELGRVVISEESIVRGQLVFQKYGLMDYGSMFGDGANRGPDYTAEALHLIQRGMVDHYENAMSPSRSRTDSLLHEGIVLRVQRELKENRYNPSTNTIVVNAAQEEAANDVQHYYYAMFTDAQRVGAVRPSRLITSREELNDLASFFYWGAWVCAAQRPGETFSYTHNWPYDPVAGNTPTGPVVLWSIIGALGLMLGLGIVLFFHGSLDNLSMHSYTDATRPYMSEADVLAFTPNPLQRYAFRFLYVAIMLFGLQVLAGILTVHDFVGFVTFFDVDISRTLPIVITRSWHVQLSILWISACWIGGSLFVMSMISPRQPHGQLVLMRIIFVTTVVMVAGMLVGVFMGPHGLLSTTWYWFGHQGWEYVELGKAWQVLLAVVLVLWAVTLYRGLRPAWEKRQPWALPRWMTYATASIVVLLMSGFVAQPSTNFVIADFWRWCVIHMWAEAFFEVFTTVLIGYFLVLMGLVNKQAAIRVIYIATLLFLGSGLLGISHNFYWNAKPVGTMALGAVFSTLQVIPLVLLTREAWRFAHVPSAVEADGASRGRTDVFGFRDVFLFLVGVNFWNFFGAGVLGFIINLPIANYYEHGSYLTVNHGHAALMGVYGNLAIAAVLFCSKLIAGPSGWNARIVRTSFWSINIGLLLMVLLDLFPVGLWQFLTIVNEGFWKARSSMFIDSTGFQTFTWLRIIGGALFTLGGVLPLMWLMVSVGRHQKGEGRHLSSNDPSR